MLSEKPEAKRAIVTDLDTNPDNVILAIAISTPLKSDIKGLRYQKCIVLHHAHNIKARAIIKKYFERSGR